jgi:hypothetical protein
MTFETRARREAQEALDSVRGVSVMEQLVELKKQDRSRRRTSAIVGACAAAVVIVAGAWFFTSRPEAPATLQPADTTSESPHGLCATYPTLVCLGDNRYQVGLEQPVTFTLPSDFGENLNFTPGSTVLDLYRNDAASGVAVFEKAVPAKYDESWTRDASAGDTAESVARWLSRRPFLQHTSVNQTTLSGHPAWVVTGSLKPGAALPAAKDSIGDVAPTFVNATGQAAYGKHLTGEYTLADIHGAGLVVVWSWTLEHDDLTPNQVLIDSLSFD